MKTIIANWKANKSPDEAVEWMHVFSQNIFSNTSLLTALKAKKMQIIIAAPFPCLEKLHFMCPPSTYTASQDISQFPTGSYTGEVSAELLTHLVQYCIVGHSERRSLLGENEHAIAAKLHQLQEHHINSILCIRNDHDTIYPSATMVAYEPVEAIGTGKNSTLEDIFEIKKKLKLNEHQKFIYGGSVNVESCKYYLESPLLDGILVGGASLDPNVFFKVVTSLLLR